MALLSLFFDLHCGVICLYDLHLRIYIADLLDCMIYVHELKIKLLKSKLESCPVSSCSRSQYLGIL